MDENVWYVSIMAAPVDFFVMRPETVFFGIVFSVPGSNLSRVHLSRFVWICNVLATWVLKRPLIFSVRVRNNPETCPGRHRQQQFPVSLAAGLLIFRIFSLGRPVFVCLPKSAHRGVNVGLGLV
jgi:hypothetical protein